SPDLVVLDPPRAGLGKRVTRLLVELGAKRLRYVSCDPATLARDLAPLLAAGYRIEEAHLFDLFPQTFHIESVMLLARRLLSRRPVTPGRRGASEGLWPPPDAPGPSRPAPRPSISLTGDPS